MRKRFPHVLLALAIGGLAAAAIPVAHSAPQDHAEAPDAAPEKDSLESGLNRRVGGDMTVAVEKRGFSYFSGNASVTTPLPEGYPAPTPPGAIDIKHYPSVRRAQVTVDASVNPDRGQNSSFWPLFRHIQANGIAMTAPVEMEYTGLSADGKGDLTQWTMSFLYRTPDLHPIGTDNENESVLIVDTEPVTVLSAGFTGEYSLLRVRAELFRLHKWLDENPGWEAAGEPRSFGYNDPSVSRSRRWGEVQIPIRQVAEIEEPKEAAPDAMDATEPGE